MASTSISKTFPSTRPCPRGKEITSSEGKGNDTGAKEQVKLKPEAHSRAIHGDRYDGRWWDKSFNPKSGVDLGRLMLRKNPKNGAEIRMIRYPKGIVEHLAPCVHSHPGARANSARHGRALGTGSSSWKANFRTHQGTYGPGTWVWFPRGEIMEHGAPDAGDMTGIFIADGACDIFFSKATSSRSNRSG